MVIGTHRLVQKDVKFKDLGLMIIDEEQRFGVAQKEKLKTAYPNIDVLTLSATPIPRTLNMAMCGIRDMSVIEEAPHGPPPGADLCAGTRSIRGASDAIRRGTAPRRPGVLSAQPRGKHRRRGDETPAAHPGSADRRRRTAK